MQQTEGGLICRGGDINNIYIYLGLSHENMLILSSVFFSQLSAIMDHKAHINKRGVIPWVEGVGGHMH